jgi:hypothetical protein
MNARIQGKYACGRGLEAEFNLLLRLSNATISSVDLIGSARQFEIDEKERVDIILTIHPSVGKRNAASREISPKTAETAARLFLQLIMRKLKRQQTWAKRPALPEGSNNYTKTRPCSSACWKQPPLYSGIGC